MQKIPIGRARLARPFLYAFQVDIMFLVPGVKSSKKISFIYTKTICVIVILTMNDRS